MIVPTAGWRHKWSSVRAIELKYLLEIADDLVAAMGVALRCEWSGQRQQSFTDCRTRIVLDYSPVARRRAPFSDRTICQVKGQAAHEAGHCRYTTAEAADILAEIGAAHSLSPSESNLLHRIFNILEDGYIEQQIGDEFPDLATYIDALNRLIFTRPIRRQMRTSVTNGAGPGAHLNALLGFSVLNWRHVPHGVPRRVGSHLRALRQSVRVFKGQHDVRQRVQHALRIFSQFRDLFPDVDQAATVPACDQQVICATLHGSRSLSPELAAAVDQAIAGDAEDLSAAVQAMTAPTSRSEAVTTLLTQAPFDAAAAEQLSADASPYVAEVARALHLRATRAASKQRRLPSGKLTTSHLYRVALGAVDVFERRVRKQPDVALGLLLDCSGSTSSIWRVCQQCAWAIVEGLHRRKGVTLDVAAYQGLDQRCQITKLYAPSMGQLCFGDLRPQGSTPSAEALAAMVTILQQLRAAHRWILHVTDGVPDDQAATKSAISEISRRGVTVMTVAITEQANARQLQDCYGRRCTVLSDIRDLPRVLAELTASVVATDR